MVKFLRKFQGVAKKIVRVNSNRCAKQLIFFPALAQYLPCISPQVTSS